MEAIGKSKREFIAKFLSDLAKTMFAIGIASAFFREFPMQVRIGLWTVFIALCGSSVWMYPERQEE